MIISLWVWGCISSDPQNVSQNSHRLTFLATRWWRNCRKLQWYDLRPTFYQIYFFSPKGWVKKRFGPFGWFFVSRDEDPLWLILGDFVKLNWPAVDSAWSHNRSNQDQGVCRMAWRWNFVVKSRWPFLRCASTASCWGARLWQLGWKKLWDVSNCWSLNNVGSLSVEKCQ